MMPLMGSLERILLGNPLGGSYTGGEKSMWEQGSIDTTTGDEVTSSYCVRSGYIPVRSNVYYTQRTISGGFHLMTWYYYDSEHNFLGYLNESSFKLLVLAPVNCTYIRIVIYSYGEAIHPTDVPNITIEDRSIWGWQDKTPGGYIYSTKSIETITGHYYFQTNDNSYKIVLNACGTTISNGSIVRVVCSGEDIFYINDPDATPTNIGDLVFEDRDVWGWYNYNNMYLISQAFPIEKRIVSAIYTGDLKKPYMGVYSQNGSVSESQLLPLENVAIADVYVLYRVFVELSDNPNITPADMVNHGTWTVTFSDPVSEVWQSDGSVYYTPHNSEIQKGKILTITPPSSFKAVSLVVQDSTGQNSHDITGGAEVALSESTEWVYLTVGIAENPDVNLTNIDSFREQWSYSYKDIPVPAEPHWDGENFVFSVSDIQVGKAWQKSGDDIIIVDDAGSVALPMIPNPSAGWRILLNNNLGVTMSGMQLRKTSAGVSVQESYIYSGSSLSIILGEEGAQVAFYGANSIGASAEDIYRGITITGSEG